MVSLGRVEIRAGIPGVGIEQTDDGHYAYPVMTDDFRKLLEQRGFEVNFDHPREDRRSISLNAADAWLPILAFTASVIENVPADVLSSIIMQYFGLELPSRTLHVKFKVVESDGTESEFTANGPGKSVVEAIDAFQRRRRNR